MFECQAELTPNACSFLYYLNRFFSKNIEIMIVSELTHAHTYTLLLEDIELITAAQGRNSYVILTFSEEFDQYNNLSYIINNLYSVSGRF